MPSAACRVLDVRDLEPPEPMERVLDALPELVEGERLCMIHRREPYPLYPILRRDGYRYETSLTPDGDYQIIIWR